MTPLNVAIALMAGATTIVLMEGLSPWLMIAMVPIVCTLIVALAMLNVLDYLHEDVTAIDALVELLRAKHKGETLLDTAKRLRRNAKENNK